MKESPMKLLWYNEAMTTFLKKISQLDWSSLINWRSRTWKILTTFLKNSEEASPKNRVYASFSQPEKSAILSYNHQTHPANVAPMRRDLWFSTSTIQPHFLSSVQPNFHTPMVFPGPCQHLEQDSGLLSSMSSQSITCTCWQAQNSARGYGSTYFQQKQTPTFWNPTSWTHLFLKLCKGLWCRLQCTNIGRRP